MKSLKLELLSLEDRRVPAAFTTRAPVSPPPDVPAVVAMAAPTMALKAGTDAGSGGTQLDKLAANHNQTLVRDRRSRTSRRR